MIHCWWWWGLGFLYGLIRNCMINDQASIWLCWAPPALAHTRTQTHANHYTTDSHCLPTVQRSEQQLSYLLFPDQSQVFVEIILSSLHLLLLPCAPATSDHRLPGEGGASEQQAASTSPLFTSSFLLIALWSQLNSWWDGKKTHLTRNFLIPLSSHRALVHNRSQNGSDQIGGSNS